LIIPDAKLLLKPAVKYNCDYPRCTASPIASNKKIIVTIADGQLSGKKKLQGLSHQIKNAWT
jgi:hypothetical protein